MSNRQIQRAIARRLYDKFSLAWRRDVRLAGRQGSPGTRKPTFAAWYGMHMGSTGMMAKSTPEDVREFVSVDGIDPWAEPMPIYQKSAEEMVGDLNDEIVIPTVPIKNSDDE